MECTIIIDVGTSSLKSIIYSLNGTLIHEQSQEYHTVITGGDNVEQAPETWHGALLSTLRDTAEYVRKRFKYKCNYRNISKGICDSGGYRRAAIVQCHYVAG
jgi:glycerol kinase